MKHVAILFVTCFVAGLSFAHPLFAQSSKLQDLEEGSPSFLITAELLKATIPAVEACLSTLEERGIPHDTLKKSGFRLTKQTKRSIAYELNLSNISSLVSYDLKRNDCYVNAGSPPDVSPNHYFAVIQAVFVKNGWESYQAEGRFLILVKGNHRTKFLGKIANNVVRFSFEKLVS